MAAGRITLGTITLAAALLSVVLPAAASLERDLLARWYGLLGTANAVAMDGLIARNARIQLVDIGVTQNKREFLASLSEFKEAIAGGSIRYRVEQASANAATALVCYHFASNDLLTRERFTFRQGLVTASVQETVAENCDQFADQ